MPRTAPTPRKAVGLSLNPATLEKLFVGRVLLDIRCFTLFRDVLLFRVFDRCILMGAGFVF
jgi:hypothetical protein